MDRMKDKLEVAKGKNKAPLVLKNASIINVYTQTIDIADIAISDDTIVGIGSYQGIKEIDCSGKYVAQGFIDSHVHIESAMVTPEVFSHLVIKRGVTTIVADPHEIANVMGLAGIKLMLKNSEKAVIDNYFMLPSCVPAVSFEDNGATLNAQKLQKLINHPKVLGLGEVMDVGSVINGNSDMLSKIEMTKAHRKNVDGHAPMLSGNDLNAYLTSGIKTDHECTSAEEANEKVKLGMYVMMREGSQTRDLSRLIGAVNEGNYSRFLFCTDDRHIEDLMEEGTIDHNIRLSIELGLDPIKAYTIASLNPATCFKLHDRGAIAPGLKADLVIFTDLEKLNIETVFKNGRAYDGIMTTTPIVTKNSVHVKSVTEAIFKIEKRADYVNVIKVHPKTLNTTKVVRQVEETNGFVSKVIGEEPICKISVIERHKNTGKYFTGYIEGLGLENAAIAQCIAHDSHNIIVAGTNDTDMEIATNTLIKMGGGIVFVAEGKVCGSISLPIGGIMTAEKGEIVCEKIRKLNELARFHGVKEGIDPFIALSFMALPVIPDVKITPRGLFDYTIFNFINLFTEKSE